MIEFDHKRGDTLRIVWTITDDGAAADLTGCVATSQLRRGGELSGNFWIDSYDNVIQATIADTSAFEVGRHVTDLQIIAAAGFIVSSPTVAVNIIEDVTQ